MCAYIYYVNMTIYSCLVLWPLPLSSGGFSVVQCFSVVQTTCLYDIWLVFLFFYSVLADYLLPWTLCIDLTELCQKSPQPVLKPELYLPWTPQWPTMTAFLLDSNLWFPIVLLLTIAAGCTSYYITQRAPLLFHFTHQFFYAKFMLFDEKGSGSPWKSDISKQQWSMSHQGRITLA